ncbi:MAG TPA: hypoxanthine phosphoribosyltransferase [bacterium]|nr:hypoxanthine phosphoribosyltransferase [bacterium]
MKLKYCKNEIKKVLISEKQINSKIKELAKKITKDYENKDLVVICVLRGSIMFVCDLIRKIDLPLEVDFFWVKSYQEMDTTGTVKILKKPDSVLKNRDILLIDDILDTGHTFAKLVEEIQKYQPKSLKIAAFLDKPSRRIVEVKLDYCGFVVPNEFVVGYGLDFNQKYRNLPYIGVLK